MKELEAKLLSKFLNRMLRWNPKNRATARDLLDDNWLKVGKLDKNSHMSRAYYTEWRRATGDNVSSSETSDSNEDDGESFEEETDSNQNDSEDQSEENEDGDTTLKQTLMDTVPNVTGLNYKPEG